MKTNLKILFIFLIIAGVGISFAQFQKVAEKDKSDSAQTESKLVTLGSLQTTVTGTGQVIPNLSVEVKCKASGTILKLPFEESDAVKKGDLLMELDPRDEENNVRQAEVSLDATVSRLAQAEQSLAIAIRNIVIISNRAQTELKKAKEQAQNSSKKAARLKTLLGKKIISQEDYDDAQTLAIIAECSEEDARLELANIELEKLSLEQKRQDVQISKTEVESRKIDLSIARRRLQETSITAPMDGIVSTRDVQIGQIVSSGISNVGGGTTILTLIDLSRIFVYAYIDESSIGQLRNGQNAKISVDAFPGQEFDGKVVRISPEGRNSSNVVTFETKIEVTDTRKSILKPQMTASVDILVEEREKCLSLPSEALFRKGAQLFVRLINKDGTTSEKLVETGISDGLVTEIKSGLQEGDRVEINQQTALSKWKQTSTQESTQDTQGPQGPQGPQAPQASAMPMKGR
ncbi:MAG: efflux RND transporter periplasmic adaptor subunit [Candidatus Riflebacteria bacterium]|nr:efflux RND transporter periplasmic adaptor subunit [Candidatus Riflebacteria bacterium]